MTKTNKTSRTKRNAVNRFEIHDRGPTVKWRPEAGIPERILNVFEALDHETAIEDGDDWRPNTPEEDRLDEWLEARGRMIRMTSPTAD